MDGVTQHVIFYPRQEIFWRYQVFYHKINLKSQGILFVLFATYVI